MSTKFPTSDHAEVPAPPLTVLLQNASHAVLDALVTRLHAMGYDTVTASHLVLFGNLNCGATHAAQIAQRMQVSRQAVSKTLRELQAQGLVTLDDDPKRRNQKRVVMTDRGGALALDARRELALIEAALAERIGADLASSLRRALEVGWGRDDAGN